MKLQKQLVVFIWKHRYTFSRIDFFKTGVTIAVFQMEGKHPEVSDLFMIIVIDGIKMSIQFFKRGTAKFTTF